jgi:aerobic C4-dicarboxylate transport protein
LSTLKKIISNLAFQVLVAILLGVAIGHFYPATGVKMEIIGKSFVDIIKLFIGPIIFLTITLGIGSIGDLKKVGRVGLKALIYFEVVTTFALAIGIIVALVVKPGHINREGLTIQDASKYTKQAEHAFDWLQFFMSNLHCKF